MGAVKCGLLSTYEFAPDQECHAPIATGLMPTGVWR
jgi:hypothetical protein